MSPTLDETATTDDPRGRFDHHAALLFGVLQRAVQFDGLPSPHGVTPRDYAPSGLHFDTVAEVDDWAAKLATEAVLEPHVYGDLQCWRKLHARGALEGVELEAWCPVEVDENGSPVGQAIGARL